VLPYESIVGMSAFWERCVKRKEPMMKISFLESDSERYSEAEPPGIDGLESTSVAINGFWHLKGICDYSTHDICERGKGR
jgi:hypothetical protein